MADPTKYTPGYDFSNYQANTPNKPLPGDRLDVELADIAQSIDETVEALKDVRRADGKLQNGSVTTDALDPSVATGLAGDVIVALGPQLDQVVQDALPEWRGAWATGRAYALNDLAREAGSTYICVAAHTSGVFSADLSAGRWEMFAQQGATGAGTGNMLAANNLSELTNFATARANLGVAAASATLLKADNLTGLGNPAAARANLGAQAADPTLTALADFNTNGLLAQTAPDTFAGRTITAGAGIAVQNGNGVAGNPVISATALNPAENRIINGAFDVWQSGTSFGSGGGVHIADQWLRFLLGGSANTTREAFPLGEKLGANNPRFFLRQTVSGQTLPSEYCIVAQPIEDVRNYAGETITVLGWMRRSSGAGNVFVSASQIFGADSGGSPLVPIFGGLVTLTTSWAPFAISMAIPSITGRVIGTNNDSRLRIQFWISAGANEVAGVPGFGLQTIGVDFWGVHIKRGTFPASEALNYIALDETAELARAQRYFYRVAQSGANRPGVRVQGYGPNGATILESYLHPVRMRAAPQGSVGGTWGVTNCGQPSIGSASETGFEIFVINTSGSLNLVDAFPNSADDFVQMDARLT